MAAQLEGRVQDIHDKLRGQLAGRGASGIHSLQRAFQVADPEGSGSLPGDDATEVLSYAGLFLSKHEAWDLLHFYGDGESIAYPRFLRDLVPPMNDRRVQIVTKAFEALDTERTGAVEVAHLAARFNGSRHPQVRTGELHEEDALEQFLRVLDDRAGGSCTAVTQADFAEYYAEVGATISSDDLFVDLVESVWGVRESASAADTQRLHRLVQLLQEKVRQKTRTGHDERLALQQAFKFVDLDETGFVAMNDFSRALERYGVPLSRAEVQGVFNALGVTDSVSYVEFSNVVFAE